MSDITLVFPAVSDDLVSNMLVAITKKIDESGSEIAIQGLLGGEHGYGAHYKNDVFEMRPFYWGDCICEYDTLRNEWEDNNKHDDNCYQTIFHEMHYVDYPNSFDYKEGHGFKDECDCVKQVCAMFKIDPEAPGSHVHCTCMHDINYANFLKTINHDDDCEMDKPNFKHYASGIEVEWYKYIGRDMDYDPEITVEKWVDVFKECLESIKEKK